MSSPFNEKAAHELNATKQVPAHIAPLTQDALVTTTGFLPRDHNLKFEDQSAMMGSSRKTERRAFGLPKEWMPRMNDISGEDTVAEWPGHLKKKSLGGRIWNLPLEIVGNG